VEYLALYTFICKCLFVMIDWQITLSFQVEVQHHWIRHLDCEVITVYDIESWVVNR
jgi:hypothetical protein